MQCMKCGRDTEDEQVFCEICKETMAKYPVKPGIVVQLPHRTVQTVKKQPVRRRPAVSAEEQLKRMRWLVRSQIALVVLLLAAVIGLSWLVVDLHQENEKKVLPGQNYVTATASTEETTESATIPTEDIAG